MKKEFIKSWKSSTQPRKQRKYTAKAPLHLKRKLLSVNLSKDLRKKHKKRNLPVKKGDVVKVMRGKFKKKQGKVLKVEVSKLKITIEGIQVKKLDGSKANAKMRASNLQIIELNMEDKKRLGIKNQDKKSEKKQEVKKVESKETKPKTNKK